MASIDKRTGGAYRARWREYPGGPQKSRQFTRKADAERFLDTIRGDLARGTYIDPADAKVPFQAFAEEWRVAQLHRASTATQCETYLRVHAYPILGHRPLGAIRRSEIQAWVKGRSLVLAPGSVELVYRWVATIFKAAVGDRLIPFSPCDRIALPKGPPREVVPLEVEAVERLIGAIQPRLRALVPFAAGTGLRQGECFGLTVDRVDFLRRQVRVDRQLVSAKGGVPVWGPPKSQASFRTVPLPHHVGDALAAHLATYRNRRHQLVFANRSGEPLRRSAFGAAWRRAAVRAELPEGATFHDLRHFYASLLISRNCSIKAVQKSLGHNPRPRRSTPTATCGPTARTRPAPRSTACSASSRSDRHHVTSCAIAASAAGGHRVGLRRKLYQLLGGGEEPEPVTSTEPREIGYVPLWQSQILVTRLCEEGFHAYAIDDPRVGAMGAIPLQPMSTVYVAALEAAAARTRLDEQNPS